MKVTKISNFIIAGLLMSCDTGDKNYDATGAFEADEIIISSEVSGTLEVFQIDEGQELEAGEYIGYIDTTQLFLQKMQLEAQKRSILSRKPDFSAQLASLEEQLKLAQVEQNRINGLYQKDAATKQQLDDINAQTEIINGNIRASRNRLTRDYSSLDLEAEALDAQIKITNDNIRKSVLVNPVNGTVLMTFVEQHEKATPGKALYKIADLSTITLKVYLTGDQLPQIKLGQEVLVRTDNGQGGYIESSGTIYWINDKAEFTPKSIQTKAERANKVYATKIRVKNDGTFKIGMYGEIIL